MLDFIVDSSRISQKFHIPCSVVGEGDEFVFDDACLKVFECLKENFILAVIIVSLDRSMPFEVMCDASNVAVGADLGLRRREDSISNLSC